jgi:hypothetical protein
MGALNGYLRPITRCLALGSLAPDPGRLSRHKIPKQLDRIGAKRAGNRNKLDDVNTALAAFVFGNERLRPTKFFGQRLLPNARGMSHCDKYCDQAFIFCGF